MSHLLSSVHFTERTNVNQEEIWSINVKVKDME